MSDSVSVRRGLRTGMMVLAVIAAAFFAFLLLEAVSIKEWRSRELPGGGRAFVIYYRDFFGEFNHVTMTINEWLLSVCGCNKVTAIGLSSHGDVGVWKHTFDW